MKEAEMKVAMKAARERIVELEELLEDSYTLTDIQAETIHELQEDNRRLRGQLKILRVDRRYEIA